MRKVSFERGVVKGTKGLPTVFISHPADTIILTLLKGSVFAYPFFVCTRKLR